MKVELTEQDVQNTIVFLNRANLTGTESMTHAVLLQKYEAARQAKKAPLPAVDADKPNRATRRKAKKGQQPHE